MVLKKICIWVATACFLGLLPNMCSAAHTDFVSYGSHDVITLGKNVNYTFDDDGEKVTFKMDDNRCLHLFAKKSGEDYLSFIPYLTNISTDNYKVREVHTESPEMTFYEIISLSGDVNTGYWLIGKNKGKWVTYVSYDSFINMGMKSGINHEINSNIVDNRLILQTTVNGKTDCAIEPFWDNSAKWFGLNSLTEQFKKEEAKSADVWITSTNGYDYYISPNTIKITPRESLSYKEQEYCSGYTRVTMKTVWNGKLLEKYDVTISLDEGGTTYYKHDGTMRYADSVGVHPVYRPLYNWLHSHNYL